MRLFVLALLLVGCAEQQGEWKELARPDGSYLVNTASGTTVRLMEGETAVGSVFISVDRQSQAKYVFVEAGGRELEAFVWPDRVELSSDGGETFVSYEPDTLDERALAPYADLFELATAVLTDERIVALARPDSEIQVGAGTARAAMITGDEAYWCGVGTAGAMIIGGPATGFLYAMACGMWADMDSW